MTMLNFGWQLLLLGKWFPGALCSLRMVLVGYERWYNNEFSWEKLFSWEAMHSNKNLVPIVSWPATFKCLQFGVMLKIVLMTNPVTTQLSVHLFFCALKYLRKDNHLHNDQFYLWFPAWFYRWQRSYCNIG